MTAYFYLSAVILLWAATPLIVTELSKQLPVFEITFLTTGFATATMALAISIKRKWKRFRAYSGRDFLAMGLLGSAGIFPYTTLYYLALSLAPSSAGEINIINYMWPIWIIILSSLILKEKISLMKIAGILISFAGVYVILSGGNLIRFQVARFQAYAIAGAGAFFWGLFSVLGKRNRFEALTAMFVHDLAALVCFAMLAFGLSSFRAPSAAHWGLLLLLGGLVNGLGYLFWILALRKGDTAKLSMAVYLTPFVALLYLALFGREIVMPFHLAALVLIIAGPVIQRFTGNNDTRTP